MFTVRDIIFGVVVPTLISAFLIGIAWQPWCASITPRPSLWAGPFGISMSFLIAFVAITHVWPVPPHDATDWLFVIALGCIIVGMPDSLWVLPSSVRIATGCLFLTGTLWLLLRPLPPVSLSSEGKFGWIVGLGLLLSAWWILLDGSGRLRHGTLTPVLLLIVAGSSALVLMLSRSKLLGQLAGVVAMTLVPWLAVAFVSKSSSLSRGGLLTVVALLGGLIVCGYFYAYLTLLNGGLLLAAGTVSAAGSAVQTKILQGRKGYVLQLLLALAPAALAVTLAAVEFAKSMSESPDYSY